MKSEKSKYPVIQLYEYSPQSVSHKDDLHTEDLTVFDDDGVVHWLNVYGIDNPEEIEKICNIYSIHSLALQDILDRQQRAKFREYDNHLFFTVKSIMPSHGVLHIAVDQMSFVIGKNYLISFHEKKMEYFASVHKKIAESDPKLVSRGSDYLLFMLLDEIIDNYYDTSQSIEDKIEKLSSFNITLDPNPNIFKKIEGFRRSIDTIKKSLMPFHEFIVKIERDGFSYIEDRHVKYFYDLKDSVLMMFDSFDKMNIRLDSCVNLFFSIQGHKMNGIMRTLTIMSTIFIPLSFFAGVYGMNFQNLPETENRYGYFIWWVLMLMIVATLLLLFKKRRWF